MRVSGLIALLLVAAFDSKAQSIIAAVTDAASFAPRMAPGGLATIFGTGLATSTAQASSLPLPTTLGGAQVILNSSPVPLIFASPTQINFQVPSGLAAGIASLFVTVGGGNSLPFRFTVTNSAPGIFQDTGNHAIAQNAAAGFSLNTKKNPAAAGSVVVVYLTGQGAVDNPVFDGTATPTSPLATAKATPVATIGGVNAPVQFLGLTPGFVGLAQANIQIPSMPSGDYPLVIAAGTFLSASAVISVSGSGTPPPNFLTQIGQVNFPNDPVSSVVVFGNTTYVCGATRIAIIDTSNASQPVFVGAFGVADLTGNGGKCVLNTIFGRSILVDIVGPGNTASFVVYDITTPTQPNKVGQITPPQFNFFADLTFVGTSGFSSTSWFEFDSANNITVQHGGFVAFDFSSSLPQLISALVPNGQPGSSILNPRPNALALPQRFGLVYVASTTASGNNTNGNAALDVIDVSNVQNMQSVARATVSGAAIFLGLSFDNSLLFLTGNTTGFRNPGNPDFSLTGNLTLTTMNINNVRVPAPIATVNTNIPTSGTFSVAPFGSSIFAIANNPPAADLGGPGNLMVVDARNTKSPVGYPVVTQFGLSGIAAANNFLLASTINGLTIYRFAIP
ncbi:MAG TPA: IPT/TIG domain-containing protein [Bryobacteraceae bacterium]|nr:IPT/TIG domain-containing protein [Bryobacteraceae bacterium]